MDSAEPTPTTVPDHSVAAKPNAVKRLARELRIIVVVQSVALCAVGLGLFLFGCNCIPNDPAWDEIHLLCGVLALSGMIVFVFTAFWGSAKLIGSSRLSIPIRLYAWSIWGFLPLILFGIYILLDKAAAASLILFFILFGVFPLYSLIPKFFIARWLAKKGEEGTLQLVEPRALRFTWRSCCLVPAICAAVPILFIGGMIFVHRVIPPPPLVISEETTRITSPLTEHGFIDFFKALEERFTPPELATDANGYRDFVRLFGDVVHDRKPEESEFYRLQLYEKLGLDPDIPPTLVLPDFPLPPTAERLDRPWTLEEFPMFADWINEIDAPLDAIAEALRKPVFYSPLLVRPDQAQRVTPPELLSILMHETNRIRIFSRSLIQHFSARAGYRIAQGDIDGAIDDATSIMRWSRYVARSGFLMQYIIGFALEEWARTIPIGANPEHPLTAQQIRRFLAELDALPPHRPLADVIEWDRYATLSWVQLMAIADIRGMPTVELSPSLQAVPYVLFSRFDWNVIFRRINEMYDAMLEPPPRAKLASISDGTNKLSVSRVLFSYLIPGGKDALMSDATTAMLASVAVAQLERLQQFGCSENMQRMALAILLYELEHGEMPGADWTGQIQQYLGDDPEQYFSCPVHPTPARTTRYALVQYGDALPGSLDTILLVELREPVPLDRAVVTADEVLEDFSQRKLRGDGHFNDLHIAHRNGAVQFLSVFWTEEVEMRRLLGRE